MPTGELVAVILLVAGSLATIASAAWWGRGQARRRADADEENAELLAELARTEAARAAWEDRFARLRAADQEVREKFIALRGAYLALKERLKSQPSPGQLQQAEHAFATRTEQLRQALERVRQVESGSKAEAAAAREVIDALTRNVEQAKQDAADLRIELDQARQKLDEAEGKMADLARFDGRLWLRPTAGEVPAFRPRAERRALIISVLNLKGGIGKTTLTANLAATLATAERPVLMVDLDYQRSLSMLLIGDKRRKELHRHGCSLQHFLAGRTHGLADLTGRLEDLAPDVPHCAVLPNSDSPTGSDAADSLEETENRLMAEWLFDRSKPDPRFFLREALHDPGLGFGWVLLDCPPRLTTACVAALAASDFVLIPVLPDPVSTRAVENLLRTLARFKADLLPDVEVAGIVPNMLRLHNGPIRVQADALRELKSLLPALWGAPVRVFEAGIKYHSEFAESAAETDTTGRPRLAVRDDNIREIFRALAAELEGEIENESRRAATVPAKPGARARSR